MKRSTSMSNLEPILPLLEGSVTETTRLQTSNCTSTVTSTTTSTSTYYHSYSRSGGEEQRSRQSTVSYDLNSSTVSYVRSISDTNIFDGMDLQNFNADKIEQSDDSSSSDCSISNLSDSTLTFPHNLEKTKENREDEEAQGIVANLIGGKTMISVPETPFLSASEFSYRPSDTKGISSTTADNDGETVRPENIVDMVVNDVLSAKYGSLEELHHWNISPTSTVGEHRELHVEDDTYDDVEETADPPSIPATLAELELTSSEDPPNAALPLKLEEDSSLLPISPPPVDRTKKKLIRIVDWSPRYCDQFTGGIATTTVEEEGTSQGISSSSSSNPLEVFGDKPEMTFKSDEITGNEEDVKDQDKLLTKSPNDKENVSLEELDAIACSFVKNASISDERMSSPESIAPTETEISDHMDNKGEEIVDLIVAEHSEDIEERVVTEEVVSSASDLGSTMEKVAPDISLVSQGKEKVIQELEEGPYILSQLQMEMQNEDIINETQREIEIGSASENDPVLALVFNSIEANRRLPAIGEEEDQDWHRPGVSSHRSAPSLELNYQSVPAWSEEPDEPEEYAPGVLSSRETSTDSIFVESHSSSPNVAVVHRRTVSDHVGHLPRNREMDERSPPPQEEIRARAVVSRSVVANRCKSQIIHRNDSHETPSPSGSLDRNQSSSDPAINENNVAILHEQMRHGGGQPPPVHLTRKATRQSWKQHMPSFPTPHTVISPSLPSRHMVPPSSIPPVDSNANRPGDRYRVEKKKEKSGTGFLGNWFGSERHVKKKKSDRPSLDSLPGFHFGAAERGGSAPAQLKDKGLRRSTVSESVLGTKQLQQEGLPDELGFLSPTDSGPGSTSGYDDPDSAASGIQLDLPLWSRFGLFDDEEYFSWSKKFRIDQLDQKEVLRQDKMFELIRTEKKHCANLAFLKQAYRQRFLDDHELMNMSPQEIDSLIPDVLHAMLQFHLHLLDRLTQRQKEQEQIPTVADILTEELQEGGIYTSIAVQAYTTFGLNKEDSERYFDRLKKTALFRKYLEDLVASDPWYRKFEKFKTLLTKVMAHPTRYHMILEDIRKNDLSEERKEANVKAVEAAKGFAQRIDHALSVSQMTRTWDDIRRDLDWTAKTMLATNETTRPLVDFHMSLLRSDSGSGSDARKILCIGNVTVKNTAKFNGDNSCLLILFDDILVFLQRRQHKITFFPQEQAVFAVSSLHARAMERASSAHILSSSFKPMLMEMQFANKSDRSKWMSMFERAIQRAPKEVRMPARKEGEIAKERELEEKRQRQAEDEWMKKIEKMFEERKSCESIITDYMDKRMEWFDQLRSHINTMPYKGRSDLPEKVKAGIRQRFKELRQSRVEPLSKLISKCTTAREQDLLDFFDDSAEVSNLDSDSGSDTSSDGKNLPRRVQTFHGTTTPKREKGSFRRHTTVPKMNSLPSKSNTIGNIDRLNDAILDGEIVENADSGDDEQEQREEEDISARVQDLPLGMNLRSLRAATHLINEIVALRKENSHLKNDLALDKTRLSLLERSRCVPGAVAGPAVPPSETLEALRKKEQELRDEETKLKQKESDLKEQQDRLLQTEREIAEKWQALKDREQAASSTPERRDRPPTEKHQTMINPQRREKSSIPQISPALMNLSEKVQTKKKK